MKTMELWYSTTSPFARKARVAAEEMGFAGYLRLRETNPWTDESLRAINPLCKVPTLVVEGGPVLYDSGAICDYIDSLAPERRLFPEQGHARWRALALQGLCDGALTAAGRLYGARQRSPEDRSEAMMARFDKAIEAVLDELERGELTFAFPTIGDISIGVLCGYLDFRMPNRDWRAGRPRLQGWYEVFEMSTSMQGSRHRPARS